VVLEKSQEKNACTPFFGPGIAGRKAGKNVGGENCFNREYAFEPSAGPSGH
jgi:hypothetical protein